MSRTPTEPAGPQPPPGTLTQLDTHLWISGMPTPQWNLHGWGIRTVISLSEHLPPHAARKYAWATSGEAHGAGDITYHHWPIDDGDEPDPITRDLMADLAVSSMRARRPVLIHCHEGVNRCAYLAAHALWRTHGTPGPQLVDLIRERRRGTLANRVFAEAIAELGSSQP